MKKNIFMSIDKMIMEIPVSEIMVKDVKSLHEQDTVQSAVDMMAELSIAGILIKNKDNYPVGIVSEGDILKKVIHQKKDPKKVKINEIMTKHLFTIKPTSNIKETASLMKKHNISKLPVSENNILVGYVTKSDLLEKMNGIYYQNTRLRLLPILMVIELIAIEIILLLYLTK
jgi:CBS domain-containing protein